MAPKWTDDEDDKWGNTTATPDAAPSTATNESARFEEFLKRAEPLLAQVDNGYKMFSTGIELQPPRERRQQLDQLILTMQNGPRPNATLWFRFTTMKNQYLTYCARWEKLLKDVETGKIKRFAGPKRGA